MYEWQKQIQVIVDEIDNCINTIMMSADPAFPFPKAGLFRILHNKEIQRNIGHAVPRLSASQEIGICVKRSPGQQEKSAGYRL